MVEGSGWRKPPRGCLGIQPSEIAELGRLGKRPDNMLKRRLEEPSDVDFAQAGDTPTR